MYLTINVNKEFKESVCVRLLSFSLTARRAVAAFVLLYAHS